MRSSDAKQRNGRSMCFVDQIGGERLNCHRRTTRIPHYITEDDGFDVPKETKGSVVAYFTVQSMKIIQSH